MLMVSKIFLGIYYNLSIWYKLTNKNTMGAVITMIGAGVTILINYLFIPSLGYLACAIANLSCYGIMMLMSYWLGNKYYSIPYHWMKSLGYMVFAYLLYLAHHLYRVQSSDILMIHLMGVVLSLVFIVIVLIIEKQEFKKIPYLQRIYLKK
jgi:O-antigen/teichoic acid export membrane protein